MADELKVTIGASYSDSLGQRESFSAIDELIDCTGKKITKLTQTIGTSEEALNLGDVAATGSLLFIKFLETSNFVEIKSGVGGTIITKLTADRRTMHMPLGSGALAPYAIADTAACRVEIFVVSS